MRRSAFDRLSIDETGQERFCQPKRLQRGNAGPATPSVVKGITTKVVLQDRCELTRFGSDFVFERVAEILRPRDGGCEQLSGCFALAAGEGEGSGARHNVDHAEAIPHRLPQFQAGPIEMRRAWDIPTPECEVCEGAEDKVLAPNTVQILEQR